MKKIILTATIAIVSCFVSANAAQVANIAGNLHSAGIDPNETSLTITGTIDASDFDYINNTLTKLTSLNLAGVEVVAYSGDPVLLNRNTFDANEIPDYAFMGSKISSIVLPPSITAIGEGAFTSSDLLQITIPASVTKIGNAAFANCDRLSSVVIPATVTDLGESLFRGSSNLESVDASALTVSKLPNGFCAECPALANVSLPAASMSEIGDEAFLDCSSLTAIQFPALLESVGANAFNGSGLTSVDMTDLGNMSEIGDWAFANCASLANVTLAEGITKVGEGAFFGSAIESYVASPAARKVSDYQFTGVKNLNSNSALPEGTTEIGRFAFAGWDQITEFTLPSTLSKIDDNAFEGWTSLQTLYANALNSVPELGEDVWEEVDQPSVTLVVKEELINDFRAAEQWQLFHIDTTGVVAVNADADKNAAVEARFEGLTLRIISKDGEIAQLAVFDTQGRKYALVQPKAETYSLDTADWSAPIYIIAVRLADGTEANFKLARR